MKVQSRSTGILSCTKILTADFSMINSLEKNPKEKSILKSLYEINTGFWYNLKNCNRKTQLYVGKYNAFYASQVCKSVKIYISIIYITSTGSDWQAHISAQN